MPRGFDPSLNFKRNILVCFSFFLQFNYPDFSVMKEELGETITEELLFLATTVSLTLLLSAVRRGELGERRRTV